jgi:hypothetical protein
MELLILGRMATPSRSPRLSDPSGFAVGGLLALRLPLLERCRPIEKRAPRRESCQGELLKKLASVKFNKVSQLPESSSGPGGSRLFHLFRLAGAGGCNE